MKIDQDQIGELIDLINDVIIYHIEKTGHPEDSEYYKSIIKKISRGKISDDELKSIFSAARDAADHSHDQDDIYAYVDTVEEMFGMTDPEVIKQRQEEELFSKKAGSQKKQDLDALKKIAQYFDKEITPSEVTKARREFNKLRKQIFNSPSRRYNQIYKELRQLDEAIYVFKEYLQTKRNLKLLFGE